MEKKYIIEITEMYSFQIDARIENCCFATIEDLDGNILKMIDSDDIRSWTPIGSKEFIKKFKTLFGV